jgi:hypothetical protein
VGELVHPEIEINTERNVHKGRDAAMDWSQKTFDHIFRRYEPVEIRPTEDGVEVDAELRYVWRETGDVGDTSAVKIALGIRDGLISSWRLTEVEGITEI